MEAPRTLPAKARIGYEQRPGEWFRKLMATPASPERTTTLLEKLERDAERFPFAGGDMPPAVAAAVEQFRAGVASARGAIEAVNEAGGAMVFTHRRHLRH